MNKSSHILSSIPTNTIIEDSPSILLHRLHSNERQLRTLAVVLSLAGGLALSFALGVGIMIYWYLHKCKQKRRLGDETFDDDGDDSDDEKSCSAGYSYCNSRNCDYYNNTPTEIPQESTTAVIDQDILVLPLPPISLVPTPEPSAPSAKELHIHNHNNNATTSTNEELCHDCSIPPPAYTKN
jgi:hypothetical protein